VGDHRIYIRIFTKAALDVLIIPQSALFRGDGRWEQAVVDSENDV
jgi:hypothetical protein